MFHAREAQPTWTKLKRARRALSPDGSRRKRKSIKTIANERLLESLQNQAADIPIAGTLQARDPWWREKGLFAVETSYANPWQSLHDAVLERSKADLIFWAGG